MLKQRMYGMWQDYPSVNFLRKFVYLEKKTSAETK